MGLKRIGVNAAAVAAGFCLCWIVACSDEGTRLTVATGLETASSDELMAICDKYWNQSSGDGRIQYDEFVDASNALTNRGEEIRDWARERLAHDNYDARATAAYLLGRLAKRDLLGEATPAVIAELGVAANRPLGDDRDAREAIDAAIDAIGVIGDPRGIPILNGVLLSDKYEHGDDTAWNAATALGTLTGEPFMEADDPVGAARAWVRSQP